MSARGRWVLAALVAAIVTTGIVTVLLRDQSPFALAPLFSAGLLFVVAGVFAEEHRTDRVTARLLIATGLARLSAQAFVVIPNAPALPGHGVLHQP